MHTLVLLTKEYPASTKETYLNNEVPILKTKFERLLIAPVDLYRSAQAPGRMESTGPEVCIVNGKPLRQRLWQVLGKNMRCLLILLGEVINSRDTLKHISRFRYVFTYLKICYTQAQQLHAAIGNNKHSKTILYSYWFHRSAVTACMYKRFIDPSAVVISRAHSSDLYHRHWNKIIQMDEVPFMPMEHYKVKNCQRIYAISMHGAEHLIRIFPRYAHKVRAARLGVLSPDVQNVITDEHLFRIVTCSGATPNKRIYRMPEILGHLQDLNVQWVHMGGANVENMQVLQKEIDKYKVASRCTIREWMSNEDILAYYANEQVNAIVNLSKAEGIPVSIMEAFSYGIPAIATNTIGNPEIVDATCGHVIPVDFKAEEVADCLRLWMGNMNTQNLLRAGARAKQDEQYNAIVNYVTFADDIKTV